LPSAFIVLFENLRFRHTLVPYWWLLIHIRYYRSTLPSRSSCTKVIKWVNSHRTYLPSEIMRIITCIGIARTSVSSSGDYDYLPLCLLTVFLLRNTIQLLNRFNSHFSGKSGLTNWPLGSHYLLIPGWSKTFHMLFIYTMSQKKNMSAHLWQYGNWNVNCLIIRIFGTLVTQFIGHWMVVSLCSPHLHNYTISTLEITEQENLQI